MRLVTGVGRNLVYKRALALPDVQFVPGLQSNLLSCSALRKDNFRFKIGPRLFSALHNCVIQLQGSNMGGVYHFHVTPALNNESGGSHSKMAVCYATKAG